MASWTNIAPKIPGQAIAASTIDQVLDDITVLSTHTHSGSAGDGNNVLAPNSKSTNTNVTARYRLSNLGVGGDTISLGHFMPASNASWSGIFPGATDFLLAAVAEDTTYLTTNQNTASGACLVYNIPIGGCRTSLSQVETFLVNVRGRGGTDSGCIDIYFDETSVSQTACPVVRSMYNSPCAFFNFSFSPFTATKGVYTMRVRIYGKDTSSTGYGASIVGLGIAYST